MKAKKNQAMRINLDKMPGVSEGKTSNIGSEVDILEAIAEDIVD